MNAQQAFVVRKSILDVWKLLGITPRQPRESVPPVDVRRRKYVKRCCGEHCKQGFYHFSDKITGR